jgi:hypothetical protein
MWQKINLIEAVRCGRVKAYLSECVVYLLRNLRKKCREIDAVSASEACGNAGSVLNVRQTISTLSKDYCMLLIAQVVARRTFGAAVRAPRVWTIASAVPHA